MSERSPTPSPWISSAAESHASRGASPASDEDRTTSGIFGRSSGESVCWFDPASSSWKKCQASLFQEDSDGLSPTLLVPGSMRNGSISPLRTSGLPTCERGCLLWHTPTAEDCANRVFARNSRGEPKLSAQVKAWPTPSATDGSHGGRVTPAKGREGGNLIEAIAARTTWPTPTSRDWRTGDRPQSRRARNNYHTPQLNDMATPGGHLNPTWVEWLMGFPLGWTACDVSATPSYRKSRKRSGG